MKQIAASVLLLAGLAACGGGNEGADASSETQTATPTVETTPATPNTLPGDTAGAAAAPGAAAAGGGAMARMMDASGRELGQLALAEGAQGVEVTGQLRGIAPGEHAIHIHMTGKCEPPFTSAGGHWNPDNKAHGSQAPNGPHHGDIPNLTAGADSSATVRGTAPGARLREPMGLLDADGAAVVVHAKPDDYKSQPAGDAGDRIACGVVQMGS